MFPLVNTGFGLSYIGAQHLNNSSNVGANSAFNEAASLIREERDWNAEQAQLNRDFQREMASSAYQIATEDMKKAGLNPYLAYQQGGASTPSGAQASSNGFASSALSSLMSVVNNQMTNNTKLLSNVIGNLGANARQQNASQSKLISSLFSLL